MTVLVLAGVLVLALAAAAVAGDLDRGVSRPPSAVGTLRLNDDAKAIWMGEWVACRHTTMRQLARVIGVRIPADRTPQVAALMIAQKAEAPLWDAQNDLTTAIDGCRNGILWRFYHGLATH